MNWTLGPVPEAGPYLLKGRKTLKNFAKGSTPPQPWISMVGADKFPVKKIRQPHPPAQWWCDNDSCGWGEDNHFDQEYDTKYIQECLLNGHEVTLQQGLQRIVIHPEHIGVDWSGDDPEDTE